MQANDDRSQADASRLVGSDVRVVVAALAGLAAAWAAAGSVGLLAHALGRALTLGLLAVAVLVLPFPLKWTKALLVRLTAAVIAAVLMVASSQPVVNISAVALLLAFLASLFSDRDRSVLLSASVGVMALALYRLTYTTIPLVWMAADSFGHGLGRLAGLLSSRPLNVGATFAGLDYLVVMLTLWAAWTAMAGGPWVKRATYGLIGIAAGHFAYLLALSYVPDLLAAVPRPAAQESWSWAGFFHKAVPWNVPVLACAIHTLIAVALLRWSSWMPPVGWAVPTNSAWKRWSDGGHSPPYVVFLLVAAMLPVVTSLHPFQPGLHGKKIVLYEKGFLNWLKPTHGSYGRLGSGMYGMLPVYLESLGARSVISKDLSEEDLREADALVLIFPDQPWAEGQLDRIWSFVRRGGSLLVLGEHTTRARDGSSRFNDVLGPTDMRVAFDCGTFAVGGWLQSYEAIIHPITVGIPDDRNQLGIVIGASLQAGWRARPIAVGRWGWSDLGDEGSSRAMIGNERYDPGEKLGDLLLAAEQPVGRGKIVAFGDTSSLTNGINVSSHVFTSRLFAYLANGSAQAHALWRQLLGLLLGAAILILLIRWPNERTIVLLALGLAGSFVITAAATSHAWESFPDGRLKYPNNLAYIDASHLEASSGESWRGDGVGGLVLTLMRNGYLTLSSPQVNAERLGRAGLFISIAPHRGFSPAERAAIRNFVTNGGIFILTVGCDEAGSSRPLLSEFGFDIGTGRLNALESVPMGHFKSPYLQSEGRRVYVRFHAAWPVICTEADAQVIAYGRDNLPVIVLRRIGAGKVVVIGDTRFATNDNLEREDGEPFEGLRENADFWRWFLTLLRDETPWVPPALQGGKETEESAPVSRASSPRSEGGKGSQTRFIAFGVPTPSTLAQGGTP